MLDYLFCNFHQYGSDTSSTTGWERTGFDDAV